VGLAQLFRFLMIKLTHLSLNSRFNMSVIFTTNYFFSGRRCSQPQRYALNDRLHKSQNQADSVFQIYS
jgi:hypothetical protein